MLKSWSVEHFKPIVNSGDLKLAPVTVLAGLNSSGKSSLLQSILMVSQTLGSRVLDRPLIPNGLLVQLGTFEDIINDEKSHGRTLTTSFEFEIEKEETKSSAKRRVLDFGLNLKFARVSVQFGSAYNNLTSPSAIEASKVIVENAFLEIHSEIISRTFNRTLSLFDNDSEAETLDLKFTINKMSPNDLREFLKDVAPEYSRLTPYSDDQPNYLGEFTILNDKAEEKISGSFLVALVHFLPTRLVRKFKEEERRKQQLERGINYLFDVEITENAPLPSRIRPYVDLIELEAPITEELKKTVINLCKNEQVSDIFTGITLRDLIVWFKGLKTETRGGKKRRVSETLQNIIVKDLLETSSKKETKRDSEGLETAVNNLYVETLDQAIEQITRFFTSRIRYLGPLRADPQTSQKFSPSSELDDVGIKGEHAAAVYDANQNATIDWYNPNSKELERNTLKTALNLWVQYLNVAKEIKTVEAGQSGISWQVIHLEGQKPLPLTAVGVGVSQILPILVMGLLAPSNTLLIVEQPELHLHPGVQSRLGDFFIGLSKCKKQCLIETHSENLVNQLRYHIVTGGEQEADDCIIYFVNQDEKGASKFEPIEISPNGNILNWPSGFFDESILQEEMITVQSLKKRLVSAKS